MAKLIPDGDATTVFTSAGAAYATSLEIQTVAAGASLQAAQQVTAETNEKVAAISQGWQDSGGPGGNQQAVATEVATRAAQLQAELTRVVRQWAKPGRERALTEMLGVIAGAIAERDRLLLELRERLNASPY